MSELKDCPFCGGMAELYEGEVGFSVECTKFSCRAGTVYSDWSKDKAIEIWNKREPQYNWISVETPDDIDVFEDILCFDGCEASIDYVEVCPNTGAHYMANDTPVTHYQRLPTPPKESK